MIFRYYIIGKMKKTAFFLMFIFGAVALFAQSAKDVQFVWTDATELTMLGQFFPENPNPYHRVDTVRFKGFTAGENKQVRFGVGMICAFRTNSTIISVDPEYGDVSFPTNTMGISARGFDLYIRKDGQWINAASTVSGDKNLNKPLTLINNMDGQEKECLLYLPIQSELRELKIGVQAGKSLQPLANPFRHRIAFFGSSFTHGSSTSRPAMNYPSQLSRATGLQVLNLGCAGNCKLQSYFCDVLCATDADAFVFDSFSNPKIEEIEERLFPFIEKLQKAHPGKPLIFQRTIYRERRNFCTSTEDYERRRQERAAELMREAMKKYADVYYIETTNATSPTHETSVDGTHPGDYGYTLWAESLQKPLLKILKKYGIR